MKIVSEPNHDIPVLSMRDGNIAVITEWVGTSRYNGDIVQRYGDSLVVFGKVKGMSWPDMFVPNDRNTKTFGTCCRVRILPTGTQLEI